MKQKRVSIKEEVLRNIKLRHQKLKFINKKESKMTERDELRIYGRILSKPKVIEMPILADEVAEATFIGDIRVLVIIPAYNAELTIADSIKSVLNQTHKNIKIVVVDDHSEDNTIKIINEFDNIKVYYLIENVGTYNAINCALYNENDYDYFTLHGADDIMNENKIEAHIRGIQRGDYFASISGYKRVDYNSKNIVKTVDVGDSMVLYSKKVFNKIGYYDNTRYGGDSEYLERFKLVYENKKIINLNQILMTAYNHGDNLTQKIDGYQRDKYVNDYRRHHCYMKRQNLFFTYTTHYYGYEIIKEKLGHQKTELTVALPIFNGKDIAWLSLESLCNQKDVTFGWELIICEEIHDNMIGFEYIKPYLDRLKSAGCTSVTYIKVKNRISLAKKWKIMGENINIDSVAFLLQAADVYSPSLRLSKTHNLIVNDNYDWVDFTKGYFYSIISKRLFLYDFNGKTNLNMAFKSEFSKNIPDTDLFKGIDNFLYEHCLNSKSHFSVYHDGTLMEDSLDTHGQNQISLTRENYFDSKSDIFHRPNKNISELEINSKIIDRLENMTLK